MGRASDEESNVIAQMLFNSDANVAQGQAGDIQQVQAIQGLPQGQLNAAQRAFYEGLDALGKGDTATARKQFSEAWKNEADLTPGQRNQLKGQTYPAAAPTSGARGGPTEC